MTEFSDRVVCIGSEEILLAAAIYGANASGKSSVYNAFEYMTEYRPTPFLFDSKSENAVTNFEVYLIGKCGAIPTLKIIDIFNEAEEI